MPGVAIAGIGQVEFSKKIGHGHRIEGPAIVEERFTTIVIYPGQTAELDRFGNYLIALPEPTQG